MSMSDLQKLMIKEGTFFKQTIKELVKILEKDQVFKVVETAMDYLEFIMSAIPELIIDKL